MRVSASSAPSGSSSASTRGRLTSARASATRCFCPPDSTAGHSSALSARPTSRQRLSARDRASPATCVRGRARPRHWRARRAQGNSRGSWNITRARCSGRVRRIAKADAAGVGGLEPGDQPQQRALAAAAAADDGDELAGAESAGRCRAAPRCRRTICAGPAWSAADRARPLPTRRAVGPASRNPHDRRGVGAETEVLMTCSWLSCFLERRMPGQATRSSTRATLSASFAEQGVDQDAEHDDVDLHELARLHRHVADARTRPRWSRRRSASAT